MYDDSTGIIRRYREVFKENWMYPHLTYLRVIEAELMRERISRFGNKITADIGCHNGAFAQALQFNFTTGIDIQQRYLEDAKMRGMHTEILCSNVQSLSTLDRKWDLFVANSVLEHIDDLDGAIRSLSTSLVQGGGLIFTVPTDKNVLPQEDYLSKELSAEFRTEFNKKLIHKNLLDIDQWIELLNTHGLSVTHSRFYLNLDSQIIVNSFNPFKQVFRENYKDHNQLINDSYLETLTDVWLKLLSSYFSKEISDVSVGGVKSCVLIEATKVGL